MSARRLVVEADGGSRGNPGPAAYGALVRDAETGEVLAELAEHIGTATNNVAEYRGLLAGLRLARDLATDAEVEVRMDSKLVVEQMSGRWRIKHEDMRGLALEARAVLPAARVRYAWVPRAQNSHADRLANEALDAATGGRPWRRRPAGPQVVDEAEVEAAPLPTAAPTNRLVGWAGDLGAPTTLVLLRHGETSYTREKRFSGRGDDPGLTAQGRRQAELAAALLAERGTVEAVVSSPLRRTRETADVVSSALHLEVAEEDGFREAEFGDWDGLTFAEVQQRWPGELEAWLGSTSVPPPGGECFDDVARRVLLARDKTIARYAGRTVLVVTHVTPIKELVRAALDAPPRALFRMELQPASLSVVQWYDDGYASLRLFNDAAHLHPPPHPPPLPRS